MKDKTKKAFEDFVESLEVSSRSITDQPDGNKIYAVDPEKARENMPGVYTAAASLRMVLKHCVEENVKPPELLMAIGDFIGFAVASCGGTTNTIEALLEGAKVSFEAHAYTFAQEDKKIVKN